MSRFAQALRALRGWVRVLAPRDARVRIALWAVAIGLVAGTIELFLPVEDTFRAARAAVRMHPADQSVVVVSVDDRTLTALGVNDPRRADDARVIDRLFELGAKRVFFDRAYADATTAADDAALVAAFNRHPGQIFVGATPMLEQSDGTAVELVPHARYRSAVEIVSIYGEEGPFGLSTRFPTSSFIMGRERPSLSAQLAGLEEGSGFYRPDFAIDYATVPTIAYIHVLQGRVPPGFVRGRDVVVAPSSRASIDFHPIPFRGKAPGVYFHVIGAETLKRGYPIDLGWLPALVLAAIVVFYQAGRRHPSRRLSLAAGAVLLAGPLALDFTRFSVDVMPALACLAIGGLRLGRLARTTYRGTTGLQNIHTLQQVRTDDRVDVVALKIRNFATISATLSAQQVDELLEKAKAMLQTTVSNGEFSFDKDTFVWLQPRLSREDLEDHLRGLHALFTTSISIGSRATDLASSIGVDTDCESTLRERTETAIQSAEDAAHRGRIFLVAEPRMSADREWRVQILSELEAAIGNDEVTVCFQPKVSLATGQIVGAEALMRWNHPARGAIEPSLVVAMAEEHNRVDLITRFVLSRALSQARDALKVNPEFRVAVNISALDLRDPAFPSQVWHLLEAYRFPPANLVLEITETAPIENDEGIAAVLGSLKRLGVKLSVDDFGIGHASLHYLRRIPADEVKIDRSFVSGMDVSGEDRALVRSSIEMIHSLGRTAVAEGVESARVAELLRKMGCDAAQGYYYSKAVPIAELLTLLSREARAA